jgi:peptidoglycan LD-endopeptidase CwlK
MIVMNHVWDKITENRISELHPKIRDRVRKFINEMDKKHGIKLRITQGYRTYQQQQDLYDQGRIKPGQIVTNAKPGSSYHNFGLAFDVVPIVSGIADWNSKHWNLIGQVGKSHGFVWGGDFKSIVDKPHFEESFGRSTAQLRQMIADNKTDAKGYLIV